MGNKDMVASALQKAFEGRVNKVYLIFMTEYAFADDNEATADAQKRFSNGIKNAKKALKRAKQLSK